MKLWNIFEDWGFVWFCILWDKPSQACAQGQTLQHEATQAGSSATAAGVVHTESLQALDKMAPVDGICNSLVEQTKDIEHVDEILFGFKNIELK